MPEPKQLHRDRVLSNLSIQYRNEASIWRMVLPVVPVGSRSDLYYKYAKRESYRVADDHVGPAGMPNEIRWSVEDDNYSVKDHALGSWLPQESIDNADTPLAPRADTNEQLNFALENTHEDRVAKLVFAAATYPTGNKVTLAGTSQWSDAASNPIKDIQDAIEGTFMRANTLVFGVDTWLTLRRHAAILDAVKSSTRLQDANGGMATISEVAALFEVSNILVGRMRKETANEGQAAAYGRIWGKHAAALHVVPNPMSIKTITFGATFVETDRMTLTDFDPKRGVKGAEYIKVAWNSDEKIVASDLGYFIEDAVA